MRRFNRGDQVEIASNEEGFAGSYYEATIVTDVGRTKYIIQYRTLVKDDLSGPLREVVTAEEVRPKPPDVVEPSFRLYDVVDVFYNDGWWVGKITRTGYEDEDDKKKKKKYIVYFENTGEEMEYDEDRIRVHQDWVDGEKWVVCGGSLGGPAGLVDK